MNTAQRIILNLETYIPPGKNLDETIEFFQKSFDFYHKSFGVVVTIAPNQDMQALKESAEAASAPQSLARRKLKN